MSMIGYKNIPLSARTSRGSISLVVGVTYVREGQTLMILDSWINPLMESVLDPVERARVACEAAQRVSLWTTPRKDTHKWEEVCYG